MKKVISLFIVLIMICLPTRRMSQGSFAFSKTAKSCKRLDFGYAMQYN